MKAFAFAILSTLSFAHAEVAVDVRFKPLPSDVQPMEGTIRSHIIAAVHDWTGRFRARDCTIVVQFSIQAWSARGAGRSFVSAPYHNETFDGKRVCEEGAAQKIRTGNDPSGDDADIELYFDPEYFRSLWFDPDLKARHEALDSRM